TKDWITGRSLPALPMLAMIMENSPLADRVKPMSTEFLGFNPEKRLAKYPEATLPTMVMAAANVAQPTAPPRLYISMERPKLKKNMAPKKSLNGKTIPSIFLRYLESAK